MRMFRASLSLLGLGLLMSTLSGCMAFHSAVYAPALNAAFENIHEATATPESMGISTASYRGQDCEYLANMAEAFGKEQYNPQNDAMTVKTSGWHIDAINQVRAEQACSGDAAAQAAAPKVQLYGFCYVFAGSSIYITPNFPYRLGDNMAASQAQTEFGAYLKGTEMSDELGFCVAEDSMAKLEYQREKTLDLNDTAFGHDDIVIAWQPSGQPAAPVASAPVVAAPPVPALTAGRGWLGAYLADVTPVLARQLGVKAGQGAAVQGVAKGGAAAVARLQSLDVVLSLDGQPVSGSQQLVQLLSAKPAGTVVTLGVWRARRQQNLQAVLSATAPSDRVALGQGYCYASLPADAPDQANLVSSLFPVADATLNDLQVRGGVVAEQFRTFLLSTGVANQVGTRKALGFCDANPATVENMRKSTLALADSDTSKAARIEFVNLIWAP